MQRPLGKLAVLVLTTLSMSGAVLAADIPRKAAPVMPTHSWEGFYVGGNVGYGWGTANLNLVPGAGWTTLGNAAGAGYLAANGSPKLHEKGALGGVQAGYNWQRGVAVYGVEADFALSGIKASRNTGVITPAPD